MSKVTFSSLKLKANEEVNTFKIGNSTIEVKKYLPTEDKINLVQIALQQANQTDGLYNEVALDAYFNFYIVLYYTNITFTDLQKKEAYKTYDILVENGIIDLVLSTMDKDEYEDLYDFLEITKKNELTYKTTAAYVFSNSLSTIPEVMSAAVEQFNSITPENYQAVQNFITAANGDRTLANQPVEK